MSIEETSKGFSEITFKAWPRSFQPGDALRRAIRLQSIIRAIDGKIITTTEAYEIFIQTMERSNYIDPE